MQAALEELIGSSLQLGFALVLVGVFWLGHVLICRIRKAQRQGIRVWIGLVKPTAPRSEVLKVLAALGGIHLLISGIESLFALSGGLNDLTDHVPVAKLALIEPAPMAVCAALAYSCLRTAGSEEVLWRGLFYKRLVHWLGFHPANLLQALLFSMP